MSKITYTFFFYFHGWTSQMLHLINLILVLLSNYEKLRQKYFLIDKSWSNNQLFIDTSMSVYTDTYCILYMLIIIIKTQ